jgi:hypothetical protein
MNIAIRSALAALLLVPVLMSVGAEAKSAKWYCYAPDPTQPWVQTCYSSTSRP